MDQEDQRAGAVTGWEREGAVDREQTIGRGGLLFVRLGDRDMLHLFVALAVDEGGVGAIQREGKEGGAREADESEEAREAAESILVRAFVCALMRGSARAHVQSLASVYA